MKSPSFPNSSDLNLKQRKIENCLKSYCSVMKLLVKFVFLFITFIDQDNYFLNYNYCLKKKKQNWFYIISYVILCTYYILCIITFFFFNLMMFIVFCYVFTDITYRRHLTSLSPFFVTKKKKRHK